MNQVGLIGWLYMVIYYSLGGKDPSGFFEIFSSGSALLYFSLAPFPDPQLFPIGVCEVTRDSGWIQVLLVAY